MQQRTLRGALFGCGMISEFHLRGWNRIPEVEIVALCNRTVERAEQRRQQFVPQARVYGDLRQMLEAEQLDFIDILTTPGLHRDHCLIAKESGLHVVCQKPLCDKLDDARQLAAEMERSGRLFAVHENHRYRPWFQRIIKEMGAGSFGKVSMVKIEHLNATHPGVAYKNAAGKGVLLEYGSHLIDMMRCLLGDPRRVYSRMHHLNPGVAGESLVHVAYEYADATAVIDAGWKSAAITQSGLLVVGSEGEAYFEGTLTRGQEGRFRLTRGNELVLDATRSSYDDYAESFYLLEREFTDAMLGRGAIVQTAKEHMKTLSCTFAAYESAASGTIVGMDQ